MNKLRTPFGTFCILTALIATGCGKAEDAPLVTVATSPTPTPAPRIGVVVEGSRFAFSDKEGNRIAEISAATGAATGSSEEDAIGTMNNARALLYQKGKPAATMTANKLEPDTKTRTITGTGNVRLVSQNMSDGIVKTVRADKMVWEYDRDKVNGSGNVIIKQGDMLEMPATSFRADTTLQTVNITGGDAPITGTL